MSENPLNVLLVEDGEEDARRVIGELTRSGYKVNVRRAEDAGSLINALQERPWDVVLCDYELPRLDGHDAIYIVREHLTLDTPFIFISEGVDAETAIALMQAGAQDYVLKSNLGRLPVAVGREMDAAHTRREKRLAHDRIEEQDRLLRQLLASAPDAICFKDLQLRYLGLNQAECRLLRAVCESEVLGHTADAFLPPERARRWRDDEERVLATGEPLIDSVERMLQEDGSVQWFSMTKAPLRNRNGEITGLVGISRDVTERKLNEQIRDEFVSTVSHELRTPLTSIAGSLGLLANGAAGELPASAMHLLRIAHGNCERLVRLTNDILDIQHIEREAMEADIHPVEVGPLVEKAVEASRGYADKFGVPARIVLSSLPAIVRADPDRLIQVITNLLSNAIKFSPRGDEVIVTVDADDSEVRLSVQDHGPGIPESARGRIFEKFFQVDATDSRQKGGTGLGLAIVKQIVDRLGGRVDFEPVPGGGTIFTVHLPQSANLAADVEGVRALDDLIGRHEFKSAAQTVRQAMVRGTTFAMLRIAMDTPLEQLTADRGSAACDKTLRAVAQFLRQNVRGDDALYHTEDGRVSMLLQNISSHRALERAMVLHDELEALRVEQEGVLLEPVHFSIGLAFFPGRRDSLAGLNGAADRALDRAIAEGGSCVVVASETDALTAEAGLALGEPVPRAS